MNYQEYIENLKSDNGFIKKIGIEYGEYGEGHAKGRLRLDESNLNPFGDAHGGCIFTLADTIGGTAALTRGCNVCTLSSTIEYLHAGRNTEYLYAEASEVKNGKTISVYDIMVTDDKGTNIAKATISYYKLNPIKP